MLQEAQKITHLSPTKVIVVGVGAALLAPTVFSLLKPVAKATLKTGIIISEKTKATIAEAGEMMGDLVAEAKMEIATAQTNKSQLSAQLSPEPQKNDN